MEYAGRYKMTDMDSGAVTHVSLNRDPGKVTEEGDPVSAENLNDLEDRIEEGIEQHEMSVQESVKSASDSAKAAAVSEKNATDAASKAAASEKNAAKSEGIAKSSAEVAQSESKTSGENATQAREHASAAKEAAGKAAASESNARQAAEDARQYATSDYALQAKSWAIGGTGKRTGEDTDNAKYYAGMAKDYAASVEYRFGIDPVSGLPAIMKYEEE